MEHFVIYKSKQEPGYTASSVQYQGTTHLIVPVVMMVEGVHNGSHGPLFHSIAELGKFPESWNGIPVVVDHPEINGVNVSANQPEIIEQQKIGTVFNTRVVGQKLMADLWINEEKVRQTSSVVLAALQAGQPLEVSLGVFTEEELTAGNWNGETYEVIARNHRPDHLALLPGGVGACSVEDGCGIRANKKGGDEVNELEFNKALKDFYVSELNNNTEQGFKELVDAARQKIDSMDSENSIHFLQEVYPDFLVYEARLRVGGTKMYKQGYQFNGGALELTGNPEEVRKKVEYVALAESSGRRRTKVNNTNKEVIIMAENAEKCTPCVEKRVNDLIANSQGKFVEADREWLEALSEDQLEKMKPTEITKEVTKEVIKEVNVLSDEDKAALADYKRQLKETHDALVKEIQDNSEAGTWTPEELNAMNDSVLKRIAGILRKDAEVDYSVNSVQSIQSNASKERPLPPTGIRFKTVTK